MEQPTNNPYQTPNPHLHDESFYQHEEATKTSRLMAVIIDSIIAFIIAIPLLIGTSIFSLLMADEQPAITFYVGMAFYGVASYALVHGYLLNKYGQTVGKRLMRVYIADNDTGDTADIKTIILKRFLPITIISYIPYIGGVIALIDILLIFRSDKRCGHDLIANTRVLKAPSGY